MLEKLIIQCNVHSLLILGDFNSKISQLQQIDNVIINNPNVNELRLDLNMQVNKRGTLLVDFMEALSLLVLTLESTVIYQQKIPSTLITVLT